MSAGLAHEFNNPSAAAQRIAVHLGEVIQKIQSVAHQLHQTLEPNHWDRLIAFAGDALKNLSASRHSHSIERSDSWDVLGTWLRESGVADAWKIAPALVGAGLERGALASLRQDLPPSAFADAVRWIALRLTIHSLLDDAEQCTGRIAGLVDVVRSRRGRSAQKLLISTFISKSESALALLDHKLRNVHVIPGFFEQLRSRAGLPSELAQVWVNLLDNAADAVNGGGELSHPNAARREPKMVVEITDNGPGVPSREPLTYLRTVFHHEGRGFGQRVSA